MNLKTFLRINGTLKILLSALLLVPLLWCFYFEQNTQLGAAFLMTAAGTALMGVLFRYWGRDAPYMVLPRDALAIVTYAWFTMSVVGAFPYWLSGGIPSFADALFESVSGFTTTGSTILRDIEALPNALLFWRSLTHWIGGLGVVVLFVSIFPSLGVGGKSLFKTEVPGPITDTITPKIKDTSRSLGYTYLGLTILEIFALRWVGKLSWFDSITHSFATLATGGFSTKNSSIAAFNSPTVEWIIILFMFLAGANFGLYYLLSKGHWQRVLREAEFKFYVLLICFTTAFIALMLWWQRHYDIHDSIRSALFQVVAIITTTGFASDNYELYPVATHMLIFFLLFTGGCAGSTAGGLKLFRIVLLGQTIFHEVQKNFRPSLISKIRVGNTIISSDLIRAVLAFMGVYFMFIIIGALFLSIEGYEILTAITAAMTAVGNVGPGFGTVGPTENFAHFTPDAKVLLSILMLLGRLEFFAMLGLLHHKFWKR